MMVFLWILRSRTRMKAFDITYPSGRVVPAWSPSSSVGERPLSPHLPQGWRLGRANQCFRVGTLIPFSLFFPSSPCASLPMGTQENTQPAWLWPESRSSASSGKKRFISTLTWLSLHPSIRPSLHPSISQYIPSSSFLPGTTLGSRISEWTRQKRSLSPLPPLLY